MRLLILTNKKTNVYGDYFLLLVLAFLKGENYFLSSKTGITPARQTELSNEKEIVVKDIPHGSFSFFFFFYIRYLIRKERIQWVVQFTNNYFFSTRLPQLVVAANSEKFISKKNLYLSTKIIVASEAEKQKLISINPTAEKNIHIVTACAGDDFLAVSWSEKQAIKMQYTQGKEYFITHSNGKTEEAFTSLLKAFSSFKKWQHSSMKLVIIGKFYFTQTKEWKEKISSYKYRDDITMIEERQHQEHITLLAGAYAFLHLPKHENDVVPLLQAMQCETPCISFTSPTIQEYSDTAVLLIDLNNYEQLSDKMILLYKDETLRNQLIESGKNQAKNYSKDKALKALAAVLPTGIH